MRNIAQNSDKKFKMIWSNNVKKGEKLLTVQINFSIYFYLVICFNLHRQEWPKKYHFQNSPTNF